MPESRGDERPERHSRSSGLFVRRRRVARPYTYQETDQVQGLLPKRGGVGIWRGLPMQDRNSPNGSPQEGYSWTLRCRSAENYEDRTAAVRKK